MRPARYTTTHLVLSGGLGAVLFVVNFLLGATLAYVFGLPGLSGLVTGFTTGFLLAIAACSSPRFSTVTIAFTLYCTLAVPTVLMGPPGIYKVGVGFLSGLAYDIVAQVSRRSRVAHYAGWAAYTVVILVLTYGAFVALGLPGLEQFRKAVLVLFFVFLGEGFAGTAVGHVFFQKYLSRAAVVQRLQRDS